jgi:hypothetical protein
MRRRSPETPAARLCDTPNACVSELIPARDPKVNIAAGLRRF